MANPQTPKPPEAPPVPTAEQQPPEASAAPPIKQEQKPVRIDVGPEMHVWGGRRFGPRVVTLDQKDAIFQDDEGNFVQGKFDMCVRDLIASTQRVHAANNKRLGLMAHELGPNANRDNLKPPPIHDRLPDVTGEVENPNAAPVIQSFE